MWWSILVLSVVCRAVSGANVLAFLPLPTKSHQRFIQPLMKELAERGHNVTMYAPFPVVRDLPETLNFVYIPDTTDYLTQRIQQNGRSVISRVAGLAGGGANSLESNINSLIYRGLGLEMLQLIFEDETFRQLIDSQSEFDLLFLEVSFLQEPLVALTHRFNAPFISFFPTSNYLWTNFIHGSPYDTSYFAECLLALSDRMSLRERLYNTGFNMAMRLLYSLYYNPMAQRLMDNYLTYPGWQTRPPISHMLANASLVFINSHPAVNYPYPYSPHFIQLAGLNIQPSNPLPKDIKEFMEGGEDGVIYFSLGSLAEGSKTLGRQLGNILAKVFGELKQRVLWKWETDFHGLPPNVKIAKWFPQQDILRDEKTVLFITHGGMLSITETVYCGVPTIGIPLSGDQNKNVNHIQQLGYGVKLELNNITQQSFTWAIHELLNNHRYRENAKKQSLIFKDKPKTALETGVYWSEYVIRHKGVRQLRPAIADMPWYQEAMIDVYLTLFLIIFATIYLSWKLLYCCYRLIKAHCC